MAIDIRVRRRVVATVGILETTSTWRRVIIKWRTSSGRRAAITTTVIVIVVTARWRWASVTVSSITAWAIIAATGTIITGLVWAARTWGAGSSSAVTGNIRLSVCNTSDANTLELTAVKLLYSSLEIRRSLELNKASFTIAITACLGVDNVKARLTGEVFKILNPESM